MSTTIADAGIPLCTWAQFTQGAFADLARNYTSVPGQTDLLMEATRLCEQAAGRRLVPFTGMVETKRAVGGDVDEYGGGTGQPFDLAGISGQSLAASLGGDTSIRHIWLNEFAARYPEYWTYTGVAVSIGTTYGQQQALAAAGLRGPAPDSGHIWLNVGTYAPVGSLVTVTYGGGYSTIPADLVRAGKFMTAAIIMRELIPSQQSRDPRLLMEDAVGCLSGYMRE